MVRDAVGAGFDAYSWGAKLRITSVDRSSGAPSNPLNVRTAVTSS